jgi:hypothetical protein
MSAFEGKADMASASQNVANDRAELKLLRDAALDRLHGMLERGGKTLN